MKTFELVDDPVSGFGEIRLLVEENCRETGHFPFDPDLDFYKEMHRIGLMFAVIARVDGNPVGYCSVLLSKTHPHNKGLQMATNDAFFVSTRYRNSRIPFRLMSEVEQEAKRRGATEFMWHASAGTPFEKALSKRMPKLETIYSRAL